MSKMSQKEAVYSAVSSVLNENSITFTEGEAVKMTKELRAQVNAILFEGFKSESIELDGSYSDSQLKGYISGLQSNWLRKDKRLNGGNKYSAKNPGSRIAAGDAQLKAMRTLLSTLTAASDREEVQAAIDSRVAEIQASKVKTVTIDTESLPIELRNLVK